MTCRHCDAAADVFDDRVARRELGRYRRKGPAPTTRLLLDFLLERGVEGASLLDVGGGVGALQHELLDAGLSSAVSVDASPAHEAAARSESERRGTGARIRYLQGDVVELDDVVPEADLVTMDRVICCYPDAEALVDTTASRARRVWAVSYPRERLLMRLGVAAINLVQRLRRSPFRVYLHPTERVTAAARRHGLSPVRHANTTLWQVWLFARS